MLYRILHFLLKRSLHKHFQEIKSFNISEVPQSRPLLIAATHPNSFLDAIVIALSIKRPLHFLARSDVFTKPWASFILRKINLIPIYRLREGKENLSRNEETFKECYEILENKGAILIFAEGVSVADKLIRPLKKGLARIIFGYANGEKKEELPTIIGCGINYEHINQFRTNILLGFSDAIVWHDLIDLSKSHPNQAYKKLNDRIESSLKEHSIEIASEDEDFHHALVELDPGFEQNSLIRKALIAEKMTKLKHRDFNQYEKLRAEINRMKAVLQHYNLDFKSIKHKVDVSSRETVLMILLSPFAILGFLLNIIPFYAAKIIALKSTKNDREFYLSVRFAVGSLLWLVWTITISITLTVMFSWWFAISPLILYLLAKSYLKSKKIWLQLQSLVRLKKMKKSSADYSMLQAEIRKILKLRTSLDLMPKVEK